MILILSIDGGGLRGVIPTKILSEIEKLTNNSISNLFDVFCGTSTGGIIISGLNIKSDNGQPKYTANQIEEIYSKYGEKIFKKLNIFSYIQSLFKPKHKSDGLSNLLNEYMTEFELKNTIKPIIICSYDLKMNKPFIFKTRKAQLSDTFNYSLYDICRATSAAPTYLPLFINNSNAVFIDGGVYANNPAIVGLTEVLKYSDYYNNSKLSLNDIKILSIGCGSYNGSILNKYIPNWGILSWLGKIANVMMNGVSVSIDYELRELLPKENYLRVQIDLSDAKHVAMDDSSNATREYWINETNKQVINNKSVMDSIINFIKK